MSNLQMTREEARVALERAGVGDSVIAVTLDRTYGPPLAANYVAVDPTKRLDFPIRITLPWSALCSDNDKYGAVIRGTIEKYHPKLVLSARYRAAKNTTRAKAKEVMGEFAPLAMPLALVARVYVPDNRPGHDVANFAKNAHDAMERVVYLKDEWLHDVRWVRAGVDVDAPRAELTISLL